MSERVLFLMHEAPDSPRPRERLDQVLMALAFELEVRVAFVGAGVAQLCRSSNDRSLSGYKSLELYGVAAVLVEQQSLERSGLDVADLMMPVEVIDREALKRLLAVQDRLL
jgi:sulfur relay protein TusC/DsrF